MFISQIHIGIRFNGNRSRARSPARRAQDYFAGCPGTDDLSREGAPTSFLASAFFPT